MNTSNKILTGFTVFALLVPVAIMMALKSRVAQGKFVARSYSNWNNDNRRSTGLEGIKAIKFINKTPGTLNVNFKNEDSAYIAHGIYKEDSILVERIGDTAVITCQNAVVRNDKSYRTEIYVDISLPQLEWLHAENTRINMTGRKPLNMQSLGVVLNASAQLNLGHLQETYSGSPDQSTPPLRLEQFVISMQDANFNIGKNVELQSLQLDARGNSNLKIDSGAKISNMAGSISDSSSVNAAWNYIRSLQSSN